MQFLYPKSRQFPFDEVCEQIVRALHARNWKVPGFSVEFHDYGSGEQKLRHVRSIASDQSAIDLAHHDVVITFCRVQGALPEGRLNDIAAVNEVQLPRRSLRVYEDGSGPTYNVYVGGDWERDRRRWWTSPNQRLNNEPRRCVRYTGRYRSQLVHDEDYREYAPDGDEPRSFRTADVMEEVRAYLRDVVLPAIEEYAPADVVDDVCAELPAIPVPQGAGPFFAYGEPRDACRIETGKKNLGDLRLADRYGMHTNWRLAPLGTRGDLPAVAYDGFLWCGTTPNVPGERGRWSADVLIKVTPKDARGIYVADHAAYEKRRAELSAAIGGGRDTFTHEEIDDFVGARARTIVPLTEYAGNFEDPIYLINRELSLDEVEVVGKRAA